MRKETKSKIYKATVRPIMAYALETAKTRQMLEANEMKVLRKLVGKPKIDRIRSQQIRDHAVSNLLMSGWKEEEENGTNM